MKKIALTSLLAVFAASSAMAANVIDGNPLYMPEQGHFYSVTDLSSHSGKQDIKSWALDEEFGYGVMKNLAVNVRAGLDEEHSFDDYGWKDFGLKATFRALDLGDFKFDVYGAYDVEDGLAYHYKDLNKTKWFEKDLTKYTWTAGIRSGYTMCAFTLAGRVEFMYVNTESFNWNHNGEQYLLVGLDGQYVINDDFNLVATVEYTGELDKTDLEGETVKNAGTWMGEFGVNYNIDETKYVGLYVNGSLNHQGGNNHDDWKADQGFGFGAKFGIDF